MENLEIRAMLKQFAKAIRQFTELNGELNLGEADDSIDLELHHATSDGFEVVKLGSINAFSNSYPVVVSAPGRT